MSKILLDYAFPVTVIDPVPAASTAFLKQVCVVAKPKSGQEGSIGTFTTCTSMTAVAVKTDNTNAQQLFNAGMAKVIVLLASDLSLLKNYLVGDNLSSFYTMLISDDFEDDDVIDLASKAAGTITVSSYANLLTGTPDTVTVGATVFTAQSGAATPGTATFRAATSNDATAASLAAQINAHAVASLLVSAVAASAVVNLEAKTAGAAGNLIALAYADLGTSTVGASVSGSFLTLGDDEEMILDIGLYKGVVGVASQDLEAATQLAAMDKFCAFFTSMTNLSKSLFFAFGKFLSNPTDWTNQQYITMPLNDGITVLNDASNLFDARISFALNDSEFGNRLAFFAVGGKAIIAPYIIENLKIDIQSAGLTWINANEPQYTLKEASLLETRLQEDVINDYIGNKNWITSGSIEITLEEENFVASGDIVVAEPKALWRVFSEMRQTP